MLGFPTPLYDSSVLNIKILLWSPLSFLGVFEVYYKNLKISSQVSGILTVDDTVLLIRIFLSNYTTAKNWENNHNRKSSNLNVLGLINCIDYNWENNFMIVQKQVSKFAWPTIAFAWFWNLSSRFIGASKSIKIDTSNESHGRWQVYDGNQSEWAVHKRFMARATFRAQQASRQRGALDWSGHDPRTRTNCCWQALRTPTLNMVFGPF